MSTSTSGTIALCAFKQGYGCAYTERVFACLLLESARLEQLLHSGLQKICRPPNSIEHLVSSLTQEAVDAVMDFIEGFTIAVNGAWRALHNERIVGENTEMIRACLWQMTIFYGAALGMMGLDPQHWLLLPGVRCPF